MFRSPAPDPDGDAVAGDGHPDHDLGQVVVEVPDLPKALNPAVSPSERSPPSTG